MIRLKVFTFNDFYENTYVLYDESRECVIIDPGCNDRKEELMLSSFIAAEGLMPVRLLNTHCHIDHVFGNRYIAEQYKLQLEAHELEAGNIRSADVSADLFGLAPPRSPMPEKFLKEGDKIGFGYTELEVLFTPGHAPGHVVFYHKDSGTLIGGDVLFNESIGRTDLPGGDYQTLINSIKDKLFPLGDEVTVYPGHGPKTTIGHEKEHNPFLNQYA